MVEMSKIELDGALAALENPTRRRILERLSHEPAYALQLARELDLNQQLVEKHLKALLRKGIVKVSKVPSPRGPSRKIYSLESRISVVLDVAPNLFNARMKCFRETSDVMAIPEEVADLMKRVGMISTQEDGKRKLSPFANLIADIDRMIFGLENDRSQLLYIRDRIMNEASKAIKEIDADFMEKKVLYYILDQNDRTIEGISRNLDIREATVAEIMRRLRSELLLP